MLASAVVDDAQRRRGRARAQDLLGGFEQRAQLRAPVAGTLHGVAVDAHGDVVEEDVAVDLTDVDAPLDAVGERGKSADRIVPSDAQVAREVVARSGRHADERQPVVAGRGSHGRHRAVATGHAHRVGTAGDRLADEGREVPTGFQDDAADAERLRLLPQPDACRRAAT